MTSHRELTDAVFLKQFTAGELPPALFTHEAHLRFAWLHLERMDVERAQFNVAQQIQAYVTKLGAQDKYHHTLTMAAVQVLEHFRKQQPSLRFDALLEAFPRLLHNFEDLVQTHYSIDQLMSEEARRTYLEPDLLAF